MTLPITQTITSRPTQLPSASRPTEIKDDTPFSHLLRSKETGGSVAAIIAKNSILTQTEKSLKVQANTSSDVALALLS
jgi:hypothetical protein